MTKNVVVIINNNFYSFSRNPELKTILMKMSSFIVIYSFIAIIHRSNWVFDEGWRGWSPTFLSLSREHPQGVLSMVKWTLGINKPMSDAPRAGSETFETFTLRDVVFSGRQTYWTRSSWIIIHSFNFDNSSF